MKTVGVAGNTYMPLDCVTFDPKCEFSGPVHAQWVGNMLIVEIDTGDSMNPIIGHMENARVTFDKKWDYPGFSTAKLIDGKVVIDGLAFKAYGDGCIPLSLGNPSSPITDHDSGDEHTTEPRKPNTMSEGAD